MKKILFFIAAVFCSVSLFAQAKIGSTPLSLNPNSVLELESTSKGCVLPRFSLTGALTNVGPLNALPALLTGTIVCNTYLSFGLGAGIYYWDGTTWNFLLTPVASTAAWSLNYYDVTGTLEFLTATN